MGETVGLLLLLFRKLVPCLLCRNKELTGNVARIGPCLVVEHGEDFRIRCDPDILSCVVAKVETAHARTNTAFLTYIGTDERTHAREHHARVQTRSHTDAHTERHGTGLNSRHLRRRRSRNSNAEWDIYDKLKK